MFLPPMDPPWQLLWAPSRSPMVRHWLFRAYGPWYLETGTRISPSPRCSTRRDSPIRPMGSSAALSLPTRALLLRHPSIPTPTDQSDRNVPQARLCPAYVRGIAAPQTLMLTRRGQLRRGVHQNICRSLGITPLVNRSYPMNYQPRSAGLS